MPTTPCARIGLSRELSPNPSLIVALALARELAHPVMERISRAVPLRDDPPPRLIAEQCRSDPRAFPILRRAHETAEVAPPALRQAASTSKSSPSVEPGIEDAAARRPNSPESASLAFDQAEVSCQGDCLLFRNPEAFANIVLLNSCQLKCNPIRQGKPARLFACASGYYGKLVSTQRFELYSYE